MVFVHHPPQLLSRFRHPGFPDSSHWRPRCCAVAEPHTVEAQIADPRSQIRQVLNGGTASPSEKTGERNGRNGTLGDFNGDSNGHFSWGFHGIQWEDNWDIIGMIYGNIIYFYVKKWRSNHHQWIFFHLINDGWPVGSGIPSFQTNPHAKMMDGTPKNCEAGRMSKISLVAYRCFFWRSLQDNDVSANLNKKKCQKSPQKWVWWIIFICLHGFHMARTPGWGSSGGKTGRISSRPTGVAKIMLTIIIRINTWIHI